MGFRPSIYGHDPKNAVFGFPWMFQVLFQSVDQSTFFYIRFVLDILCFEHCIWYFVTVVVFVTITDMVMDVKSSHIVAVSRCCRLVNYNRNRLADSNATFVTCVFVCFCLYISKLMMPGGLPTCFV